MAVTNVVRTVWEVITKQKGTNMNEWNRATQRLQMTSKQLNGALEGVGLTTKEAQRSFLSMSRRGNFGIEGLNKKLQESQLAMVNTGRHAGMVEDKLKGGFMNADKALKTIQGRTARFQMQWLSIMFLMMALQRVFKGILQSALQLYIKVTENQTELAKKINGARAALTYMKFAIIDALGPLITWVSELIIKFADWISMNPEMTKMIAYILAIGAAVTTVALWAAILKLGFSGMGMAAFKAGESGAAGMALMNPAILGIIAGIAVLIAFAIISFDQLKLAASAAGKGIEEGFAQNLDKSNDYFDISFEAMSLAIEKFALVALQQFAVISAGIRAILTRLRYWFVDSILNFLISKLSGFLQKASAAVGILSPELGKKMKIGASALTSGMKTGLSELLTDAEKAETNFANKIFGGAYSSEQLRINEIEEETQRLNDIYNMLSTGTLNGLSVNVSSLEEAKELYDSLSNIPKLNLTASFNQANPAINETAEAISNVASSQERLNAAISEGSSLNFGGMFTGGMGSGTTNVNQTVNNTFEVTGVTDVDSLLEELLNNPSIMDNLFRDYKQLAVPSGGS